MRWLIAFLWCVTIAYADERVIADLSQNEVAITASFEGSELFVFGAVERIAPPPTADGPLHVIITITSPADPVMVRRKERVAGVWVNRDAVEVDHAPHFFAIASTAPLDDIVSFTDQLRHRIGLDWAVQLIDAPAEVDDTAAFREAVIRIRRDEGLYIELPNTVRLLNETLFNTRVELPANLVEGVYQARIFLTRDLEVIDVFETEIIVQKDGIERWIYDLAHERPLIYGLLSIAVALFAGWLAAEVFRYIRR